MLSFMRANQTQIMFVLSGICGMIALFACITRYPSKKRKTAQLIMAISAVVLLISEILGEKYNGDTSLTGYWMVRICNFLVYMTTLTMIHGFALYLADMIRVDLKQPVPKQLWGTMVFIGIGELLVIISQFTGLYYTIDEMNRYTRSALYPICYIFPLLGTLLLFFVILRYRRQMRTQVWITLILFAIIPLIAAIIQYFFFGLYITDMAIVGMVVVLYVFTLVDTNNTLEQAQQREVQMLKKEQEAIQDLFSQTAIALVSAIDAKDKYTQGHSVRVAEYSRKIAEISGKNEKECDEIYYAALLHDVGKIGIPDYIINKNRKLTPEEYGVNDAMTSNRSYRSHLSQEKVREELIRCSGAQFDPRFAQIMLGMINQDAGHHVDLIHKLLQIHIIPPSLFAPETEDKGNADLFISASKTTASHVVLLSPWRGRAFISVSQEFRSAFPHSTAHDSIPQKRNPPQSPKLSASVSIGKS